MLDVLLGEEIHNVAVVVTRYFGGTLLGTGGLVRAYQGATKEGLKNCVIIKKLCASKLKIITDYNGIGKLQYLLAQMEIPILNTEYTDIVIIIALIPTQSLEEFHHKIIELTNGKAEIEELETLYYATISGEIVLFN